MRDAIEIEATFLIADLSGYTALTEAHGNLHAAEAVARYVRIADAALAHGVVRVEHVGDELLFAAREAAPVVRTAVALLDAVEAEPDFPTVRMGIHRGAVVERDGRYFGAALNVTARVAAHARGGQILCTASVAPAAESVEGVTLRALGPVRLRNVSAPVEIFEVLTARAAGPPVLDPVCRMQVRPESAPARLPWGGRTYSFCSFDCARAFAAAPETYAGG